MCITLVDGHPGNKEIGDTLFTSLPYNHMLYGLWLDVVGCENPDPTGQVVVEGLLEVRRGL